MRKNKNYTTRRTVKRLGVGAASVLVGMSTASMSLPYHVLAKEAGLNHAVSTYASTRVSDRNMDLTTHYKANGIEESNLRYANTVFDSVGEDGSINLTMTKWASGSSGWASDTKNEYAGKYILAFTNSDFYKQIDRVTLDNVSLAKRDDGAMWMLDITKIPNYALIGAVTNNSIKITLKNGQTLEELGFEEQELAFESVWIKNSGAIAMESISNGFILKDNPNIKNEMNTGFTKGRMSQRVLFDSQTMSLNTVHTFKPNENYLQSDYNWVLYVKEMIPAELLEYLDRENIYIYCSKIDGTLTTPEVKFKVDIDDNGLVDTSRVSELSIIGNDTAEQLKTARLNTDKIFYGVLGQSRNYTISYKLKDDVSVADFAKAMNDYIQNKQKRVLFEHWLEADYLNTKDGGAATPQLSNSYSNAALNTNDTDGDGVFDFVEWQIGTNANAVDTDGDGVPDGQEFMEDNTDPKEAADYLVAKPKTDMTGFDPSKKVTIEGTVPKPYLEDPSTPGKLLDVTNTDAGNVIVKLHKYDETTQTFDENVEYGMTKIPFDDLLAGNFKLNIQANVVQPGEKVVLVAYSPNGKHPVMGDAFIFDKTDAERYEAKGQEIQAEKDSEPEAADGIANKDELPEGTTYSWKEKVDTSKEGETTGTVVVTYPDQTTDEVEVKITVVDSRTDAERYEAKGQEIQAEKDSEPEAADGIANKDELPEGTTYSWKEKVDTSKEGETTGTVVVTYPDQTTDEVEVKITVVDSRTDAERYDPIGQPVEIGKGEQPNAGNGIANKDELPEGTDYEWKNPIDTDKEGTQTGTIVVTYPDGSKDEVEVEIIVKDYSTDTDKYAAEGGTLNKGYGETATREEVLGKVTTDAPADKVKGMEIQGDIPTTGKGNKVQVIVTYADDTTDEAIVTINYETAAEKYHAEGGTLDKGYGETATREEILGKVTTDAPAEQVKGMEVQEDIPTAGKGNKVQVIVTYMDNTTDKATVTVNYGTAAEKYDPETKPEVIKPGDKVDLTDNVTNVDKLPDGTEIKDITPDGAIDPNTPGEYEGTLEITYPDGSKDVVSVQITVKQPETAGENTGNQGTGSKPGAVLQNKPGKSKVVKTGDVAMPAVYAGGLFSGLAALAGTLISRKKRKK